MDEKMPKKRFKIWKLALILLAVAVVAVGLRFAYVMFIDPMSAFGGNPGEAAAQTPVPVETNLLTPTPSAAAVTPTVEPATATVTPLLTPTPTPTPIPTPTPTPTPIPALDLGFMKNRVNILILGWDESPERNQEGSEVFRDEANNFRSDVIMLLTVNFKSGKADLISVPRDTYATLYQSDGTLFSETGRWKINAAFAKGGSVKGDGFGYAMATVSKLFGGVPIQYYAGVDMQGLKVVVDAMGGVDYDVDVRIVLNGRVLEKGYQHLNGQQVLDYCRARKGISSDVGRNDRQQRMMFAIFEQMKSRGQLANIVNIYQSVKGYIHTNLNLEQIAALGTFGLSLDMDNLRRHTLAGEYISNTPYNGASFYVLYNEKLAALADKVFGVAIVPSPRHDVEYVLADKAAALGNRYVAAAQYLTLQTNLVYQSGNRYMPYTLRTALGKISDLSAQLTLGCNRQVNENADLPFDRAAIEQNIEALKVMLQDLCAEVGLNQSNLSKDALPEDFFKALPVADTLPEQ